MSAADKSHPPSSALLPYPLDFKSALLAHLPGDGPGARVAVPEAAIARMELHARLLLKWARVTSLTSITDPLEIVRRHFAESLACLPFIPENGSALDLGSGAGFPGLPVQMARETGRMTLVEPTGRKAEFLRIVIDETKLANTDVVERHARTEKELAAFLPVDAFLARAIPDPLEWAMRTARLITPRGRALFFAGEETRVAIESRLADKGLSLVASVLLPSSRASWLLVIGRTG
jgi:16S rRNA (guanine527-N7)-methyltransferase